MNQPQILLSGRIVQFQTRKVRIVNKIGEGYQSVIYNVTDVNSNEFLVLKHQKKKVQWNIEISLLKEIKGKNYKNIVNVIDYVINKDDQLILMEKCECDLFAYLTKIKEDDFRYIASEISRGLKVVHDLKYIHRDIKPENIMVYKLRTQDDKTYQPIFKLGDFGIIQYQIADKKTMFVGTPYYLAPEQIQTDFTAQYTQSVDIWALGVVFYEIWTKDTLFQGQTVEEIYQNINNLDISAAISRLSLSRNYQELIISMVNRDARKRPTIDQVIDKLKPNLRITKSTNIRQLNNKIQVRNQDYIILDTICSNKTYISYKVQHFQSKMTLYLTKYYAFDDEQFKNMSMISQIKNKYWVNIYDLQVKDNELFVLTEQYSATIYDGIIKCQKLDPKDFRFIAFELSLGLYELHKAQLIHTNITPKTTMILKHYDQQTSQYTNVYKIGDFSKVQKYKSNIEEEEDYQAPEQRNQQQFTLSYKTDIWQLGALLFELFTLKKLSQIENLEQGLRELQISEQHKTLLKSMLNENANFRPSSKTLCEQLSPNIQNQIIQQVQGTGLQRIQTIQRQRQIQSSVSQIQSCVKNNNYSRNNRFIN